MPLLPKGKLLPRSPGPFLRDWLARVACLLAACSSDAKGRIDCAVIRAKMTAIFEMLRLILCPSSPASRSQPSAVFLKGVIADLPAHYADSLMPPDGLIACQHISGRVLGDFFFSPMHVSPAERTTGGKEAQPNCGCLIFKWRSPRNGPD